jgi:hypothetical protein
MYRQKQIMYDFPRVRVSIQGSGKANAEKSNMDEEKP